eukprot:s6060_g2.t2
MAFAGTWYSGIRPGRMFHAEEEDAPLGAREIAEWLKKNAPHLQERGAFASGRKHRGRPMTEVVAEDPAYCSWVLQEAEAPTASDGLREMAKWLSANASHLKDLARTRSGKHYGRPMSDLVTEDAAYCKWILRSAKDPSSSQILREKALWLKEHAPHLEACSRDGGAKHYSAASRLRFKEQLAAKAEVPITGGLQGKEELLSRLVAEDPSYCLWILRTAEEKEAAYKLRDQAAWLSKHAPHLKEQLAAKAEVPITGPSYCLRILRTAEEKEAAYKLRDQAAWLSKHAPHLKETPVVRMQSRHKGIPLPQLVAEDPGWCCFVLDQAEAKCKEFTEVAVWLRENAPELRDVSSDDEAILQDLRRRMLERYGQWFVIRYGKHRMKTFATLVEEFPGFVRWVEETVAHNTAEKGGVGKNSNNFKLLVAFARQLRSKETDTEVTLASGQILTEAFAPKATEIMAA